MSKSGRVSLAELRRAFRLIGDARDVGHDLAAWPTVLTTGLAPLIGAKVIIVGRIVLDRGEPPRNVHLSDCGWDSPLQREVWYQRYFHEHNYDRVETFHRFLPAVSGLTTRTRGQLMDDAEWYRSFEFNEINRGLGIDDMIASAASSKGPESRELFALCAVRPVGGTPFGRRQRRLLHIFHHEFARQLGRSIFLETGPFANLPPRLQRLLDCLLEGDGEKQAALRLGLSRHTIHEYAKLLYQHLDVSSRGELLALCLRHKFTPGSGADGHRRDAAN